MPLRYEKPDRSLHRELNAVARMAGALDRVLGRANFLPDDFPEDELRFWVDKLQALPAGTAEGCREPLRYAHERLSAVIRDHIGIDDEDVDGSNSEDGDASPSLARGEPIEQAITNLIGAISVANSEYERQADESLEEEERDRPFRPTSDQAATLERLTASDDPVGEETG
ncbi:MAG: hypothetical protein OEU92_29300 [Alphaproteobacteria bacterium]|nr:hypothetical protein [Alphaproteobacteria bacterium]